MSSIVIDTKDLKGALDLLILGKTKRTEKLAAGIRKLTNSREKLNESIRVPTDMFRDISETIPSAFETKNE